MADLTGLAALVVALVALLIAGLQLTQQLLATAYVIRKCDQIVTGGLTKGGTRQWHWRQFRFTVKYQAVVFALPTPLYSALGLSPTVQVNSPSLEVWERAVKLRAARTSTQGCWISFMQDLAVTACIRPEDVCVREESGDRIPEDLTVAPTRVDALTVLLSCIAMGMQVSKYSPTTGEIALAGGVGSISSSVHPVLGGLLHYSVFSNEPTIGFEAAKRHGHALRQEKGVWASAVFGRFVNRRYRPENVPLAELRTLSMTSLRSNGWPMGSYTDSIGGAACFMAFGHVDVYEAVPSSIVRPWAAHFAEVIVMAHHVQLFQDARSLDLNETPDLSPEFLKARDTFINKHGASSPYLPWNDLSIEGEKKNGVWSELVAHIESNCLFTCKSLVDCVASIKPDIRELESGERPGLRDPSSYVSMAAAWEVILRADQCMHHIEEEHSVQRFVDEIIVYAITSLAEVGPPSWGRAFNHITEWPKTLDAAFYKVIEKSQVFQRVPQHKAKWVRIYARLSILRSAYYTIMMRSAREIGPGLSEETKLDTALAYMA